MAEYTWPAGTLAERQDTIARLLWVLYRHGGTVEQEDGRAVGVLLSLLADNGVEITGGWLNKTIVDLCLGGKFGTFLRRRVNGRRTYSIALVRDPFKDEFPDDPWGDYDTSGAEPEEEEPEEVEAAAEEVDVEEVDIDDGAQEDLAVVAIEAADDDDVLVDDIEDLDDLIAMSETAATAATAVPSTALDHLPEPARSDKILYAISLLHDVLREDTERDVAKIVATQFAEFNRIAEENRELREEVERLRGDKARLASALRQATQVMQTAAQNGTRVGVPA